MPTPSIPSTWYTRKGCGFAVLTSVGMGLLSYWSGSLLLIGPTAFAWLVTTILLINTPLFWVLERGIPMLRHGDGYQHVWGFQGQSIRGIRDGNDIWLSLAECEAASALPLKDSSKHVPKSSLRQDGVLGIVLDMGSLNKILDHCKGDMSKVHRFRLFLERSVWMTRKG